MAAEDDALDAATLQIEKALTGFMDAVSDGNFSRVKRADSVVARRSSVSALAILSSRVMIRLCRQCGQTELEHQTETLMANLQELIADQRNLVG